VPPIVYYDTSNPSAGVYYANGNEYVPIYVAPQPVYQENGGGGTEYNPVPPSGHSLPIGYNSISTSKQSILNKLETDISYALKGLTSWLFNSFRKSFISLVKNVIGDRLASGLFNFFSSSIHLVGSFEQFTNQISMGFDFSQALNDSKGNVPIAVVETIVHAPIDRFFDNWGWEIGADLAEDSVRLGAMFGIDGLLAAAALAAAGLALGKAIAWGLDTISDGAVDAIVEPIVEEGEKEIEEESDGES
jgi:hypothetical protein